MIDSVSRAYYAMLYATQALLTREGVPLRQPTEVIAALGKEFVLSGRFPEQQHLHLVELYALRMRADYDVFYLVSEEEAEKHMKRARMFVEHVAGLFFNDKKK